MKSVIFNVLAFSCGAAVGILGTRAYFKRKYQEIADSEIESMKKFYEKHTEKEEKEPENDKKLEFPVTEKTSLSLDVSPEKADFYRTRYYTLSNDLAESENPRESAENNAQYQIDVDEFDLVNGYSKEEYAYYMEDGTLVDSHDNVIIIGDTVSIDNIDSFEKAAEDVWFIRNERLKTDFELTKVYASYGDIVGDEY